MNIKRLLKGAYLKDSDGYESKTTSFAEAELDRLAISTPDALILPFRPEILALCEAFGRSGQSGGSAPFTSNALSLAVKHLTLFKPIAPLTGEDSEWVNVSDFFGDDGVFQNNRLSSVFKEGDGKPYFLDAIIWRGPEEYDTFTGAVYTDDTFQELVGSSQCIEFPCIPESFTVDIYYLPIDEDEAEAKGIHYTQRNDDSCWVSVVKDKSALDKVWEVFTKRDVR